MRLKYFMTILFVLSGSLWASDSVDLVQGIKISSDDKASLEDKGNFSVFNDSLSWLEVGIGGETLELLPSSGAFFPCAGRLPEVDIQVRRQGDERFEFLRVPCATSMVVDDDFRNN